MAIRADRLVAACSGTPQAQVSSSAQAQQGGKKGGSKRMPQWLYTRAATYVNTCRAINIDTFSDACKLQADACASMHGNKITVSPRATSLPPTLLYNDLFLL
jgi:hypothetical protein